MTAIKEKRITCAACGDRVTIIRGERGDPSTYCDVCREDVKREQAGFVLLQDAGSTSRTPPRAGT